MWCWCFRQMWFRDQPDAPFQSLVKLFIEGEMNWHSTEWLWLRVWVFGLNFLFFVFFLPSLCRGPNGSCPEESGSAITDAIWLRRTEYDRSCSQYLHFAVPGSHSAAHHSHPSNRHGIPSERYGETIHWFPLNLQALLIVVSKFVILPDQVSVVWPEQDTKDNWTSDTVMVHTARLVMMHPIHGACHAVFVSCTKSSVYHETSFATRLTAFVMRSFGLARNFIFIDPHVLQSAKDWLISKQGSDGCFMQQGTLYHNDMKVCHFTSSVP